MVDCYNLPSERRGEHASTPSSAAAQEVDVLQGPSSRRHGVATATPVGGVHELNSMKTVRGTCELRPLSASEHAPDLPRRRGMAYGSN